MAIEIVHDDDVAGLEGGDQQLFHIGKEADAIDRAIENTRRIDPVMAECCEEGHCLPVAMRLFTVQFLSPAAAAMGAGHVGFGPRLVDKNQPCWVKPPLMAFPDCAPARDIRPLLLQRQHAFF